MAAAIDVNAFATAAQFGAFGALRTGDDWAIGASYAFIAKSYTFPGFDVTSTADYSYDLHIGEVTLDRILTEPENALIKQYQALLETEGIRLTFPAEAIREIAALATKVNERTENIGARRLHTIMEKLLEEISFTAPDLGEQSITITAEYVRERLANLIEDEDLSRYIL